jgi:ribonuclease HI
VGSSGGLDRVDVPDSFAVLREGEAIPRIPLVVKEEIEEVLLPHTERRFRQHQETPFGHGSRRESLGLTCESQDVQDILHGSYDRELDSLSEEARVWLLQLKEKDFVGAGGIISTHVSFGDWVQGWAKMRESTASAPGGHYGHYKTISVAARLPEDHPDHSTVLAHIYAKMMSIPLKQGFAPVRWRQCIDAIIEKIPGQPIIEKLRIIMLYEADFNFALKLVWGKRLIRNAEFYKILGTSNHGSRPGRQCVDALMEKMLVYEFARLSRTSLVTVDNDAKSCYDRIIKSLAMTACIAVGLPLMAAIMHNKTHHGMVHQIKSRHGLLRPYHGSDNDELEGTGQGSGASPAIWLIYSVSLLAAFRSFTPGIQVISPFESMMVFILAVFYVDDGMPGVNDAHEKAALPLAMLLDQAGKASQSWERLLFASGGALELTKCFAYILYWDLSNGTHRLLSPDKIPNCISEAEGSFRGPLSLTYGDTSAERHSLVTVSPWVGKRTLGVRLAPAGNWDDEFNFRRDQSRELAMLLAGSVLSKETARVGYLQMVCPKLEFPLSVTQFTQDQCDRISSPALRACMSKMGYNRNMPKEVVYGPVELFGVGLHDIFIEQGVKSVTMLVGHIRQDSDTGRMMRIELQWCQVQAGTSINLLEDPQVPIDYIETCWIMSVRDFLSMYNLHLEFSQLARPVVQCVHDEFIMDAIRARATCTATELQRVNACRLYLQVSRVSDIATADGSRIRSDVLLGQDATVFLSSDGWPRQGRPPKQWWSLWRAKLRTALSVDGVSPVLRQPLGEWYTTALNTCEWDTLVSLNSTPREVFTRQAEGGFTKYVEIEGRSGHLYIPSASSISVDSVPHGSLPAALGPVRPNGTRRISFRAGRKSAAALAIPTRSFRDFVHAQEPHICELLENGDLTESTTGAYAALLISTPDLHSGTDGGVLQGEGTYGYVWGNPHDNEIFSRGGGHVPGSSIFMSSTRAELCGILATLTYQRLVIEFYHIVAPKKGFRCTLHCDSKAALQRVKDLTYDEFGTTWRCRANYDLEAAIRLCLQKDNVTVDWQWIRGHAIRRKLRHNFVWAEILNEAADDLATAARLYPVLHDDDKHWPEQEISVIGPRGRMCGRVAHEIRYCCTAPDLLSYWQSKYGWSNQQVESLDLLGTAAASSHTGAARAARLQKLRCGWLPVNRHESRIDPDRLNGCSACSTTNLVEETVDHVFQCSSVSRRRAVMQRLDSLEAALVKLRTSSPLIRALHTGATSWVLGRECPTVVSLDLPETAVGELIAAAYTEQTALGWNVLFRGFWSSKWRLAQEAHFRVVGARERQDTGERWSGKLHNWFFDLFELLWGLRNEHEHGADPETQTLIRLTKCERAIRRLYNQGNVLPAGERHPFKTDMAVLLAQSVKNQELWISKTEAFLPKALHRLRRRANASQSVMTDYFQRLHA